MWLGGLAAGYMQNATRRIAWINRMGGTAQMYCSDHQKIG